MTRVQQHHSEISPQKFGSDGMDKICLNVGGQKHETYLSTIAHLPDTRLYWIVESVVKGSDYDPETTEIFFDRHPAVFAQVLNYYRTGKLHCPTDVCGPLFEQELNYWGIDEKDMEPCCWANYTQHRDAEENLKNVIYEASPEDPLVDNTPVDDSSELMRMWRKVQPEIWATIDESRSSSRAKIFSFTSFLFIIVSVAMFCMNTIPDLKTHNKWRTSFTLVETICGIWFTLEFLLRTVFCPDKRSYVRTWTTWIDFLAVIPFYLKLIVSSSGNAINVLLVFRLLRLFRFFRLIYGLQVLSHTLKASSYELILLLFMLFIPVILFSSVVFFIEQNLNKDNTKFHSIPHSFWWSLITITTVGYGDMHPVSWPGKIVGCMCAICGVLIVALPVSIIGSNFTLFYTHAQARLKLPRKKNKLFLPQTTTSAVYSGRHLRRKGAMRRQISTRASDCSVSNRGSYIQGTSLSCNGFTRAMDAASRNSSSGNNERLYSTGSDGKLPPRKGMSAVSVKIPSSEPTEERKGGEEQNTKNEPSICRTSLDMNEWRCTRIDSSYLETNKNSNSSEASECIPDKVGRSFCESLLCNEKQETEFLTNTRPESVPLLMETDVRIPVKREDENNDPDFIEEIPVACDVQKFVPSKKYDSQNNCEAVDEETETTASVNGDKLGHSKRVSCKREHDRTRRRSSLLRISETCGELEFNTPTSTKLSNEDIYNEDTACVEVSFDEIHFNRRRRHPVF